MRSIELLAPARDASVGRTAILAGADAVYIGAPAFGARAAAGNSVEDIAALAAFAHKYRARVYVTMNTILFDNELEEARKLVWKLYAAGVDALIVQDMAYLEMDLPPIALHASTQCDIRTPEKAALLASAGFSQLVLPREFTLAEIKAAQEAAAVPVEVFVHGALCVSYSGDCQAGQAAMGRSANRGVCPQMCRLPYELVDADGNAVAPEKHYLSLRDLDRRADLEELIDAGASSFKIEGRLKDARYVANVTAAYSQALDKIIAKRQDIFRSSAGTSVCDFTPDPDRTFNRGYTNYFLRGRGLAGRMASLDTPKWAGLPVGKVTSAPDSRGTFTASLSAELTNGDGLGYFDKSGSFHGFRLNKVEDKRLFPLGELPGLTVGTALYRNSDKAFFDVLDRTDSSCKRTIPLDFMLSEAGENHIAIAVTDARGCRAEVVIESPAQKARTPQTEARRKTLARLGDTIYELRDVDDRLGDRFVAASVLAEGRRKAVEALDTAAEATYAYDRRKKSTLEKDAFAEAAPLTYHDNVANRLSERFYKSHSATIAQKALEISGKKDAGDDLTVMTTRYCIRRELGACLREKNAKALPSPLFLRNKSGLYRLDFDCSRCGMKVVRTQ